MSTATIIVAEDEDALATLLQYNLEKEGYRVVLAGDGEEALIVIDEAKPDLLLLDWMLPKVSGIEVCRRIRQKQETRNLPVLMLTARGEESDRIRGLDTGADDYVIKPFSMTELLARIRAVLRRIRPGLADDRLSHGDIAVRPDVKAFDGDGVFFADGRREAVDVVIFATGYRRTLPILPADVRRAGQRPQLEVLEVREQFLTDRCCDLAPLILRPTHHQLAILVQRLDRERRERTKRHEEHEDGEGEAATRDGRPVGLHSPPGRIL